MKTPEDFFKAVQKFKDAGPEKFDLNLRREKRQKYPQKKEKR